MFKSIHALPNPPMGGSWKGSHLQFGLMAADVISVSYCFYRHSLSHHGEQRPLWLRVQLEKEHQFASVWGWQCEFTEEIEKTLVYLIEVEKEDGSKHFVTDPFAKESIGGEQWGNPLVMCIDSQDYRLRTSSRPHGHSFIGLRRLAVLRQENYELQAVTRPERPNHSLKDSIVYECHLRGMTQSPSSSVSEAQHCGTFRGLIECIPYLTSLGITAIELLPIFDFDENENPFTHPETGASLLNYWGYSTLLFYAPKHNYAFDLENPLREFQEMVDRFHEAGIEVWLDVVYNHTAEFGEGGHQDHFKVLAENQWYLIDDAGNHTNYSGCGNTIQCAHPISRQMIRESLYYWSNVMGVDGFRFDLAAILNRDSKGQLSEFPQFLWELKHDPLLTNIKLISEPWDAAGGYQLGNSAYHADWLEWNDRYRDSVRQAVNGGDSMMEALKLALLGSPDVYGNINKGRNSSINFITSHDGMTLMDLVSYQQKHNLDNGENNRDGSNSEHLNNCGFEGETDDPAINLLRLRKLRMYHCLLQLSNGVPMMIAGDEFGRTQKGNNNAYCHDSELTWVDWNLKLKNQKLLDFVQRMIAFRKQQSFFLHSEKSEYQWLNAAGKQEDTSSFVRTLHWHITHPDWKEYVVRVLINCFDQPVEFMLPQDISWKVLMDTDKEPDEYISPEKGSAWLEGYTIQILRGMTSTK